MPALTERNRLITENTGLVHACARRFTARGVEYEELYSCGCVGLVKAADNFDPSLGFRFSTYAVPVIMGEMKRIFRDCGSVKVSRNIRELSLRISRAVQQYQQTEGEEPTVSQLAQMLSVSAEQVTEALSATRLPLSLSEGPGEESGGFDVPVESEERAITERLALRQMMELLSSSDRELIILRYYKGKTQQQTASALGMTQVQVSRREKKILSHLREKMRE